MSDNQEIDPVESIEDFVESAISELETEEVEEVETDETEEADTDAEEPEEEEPEAEEEPESEESDEEPEEPEERLEAPEHWAATDKELFNGQPREVQEWALSRHKAMEGDYTRKSQEFASDKRQFDAITDALAPMRETFQRAGLDYAGAVRQLASWDNSLRTGGKPALMQLAQMYNIDMAEASEDEYIDPQLQSVQNELAQLRNEQARNTQAAQQEKQRQLYDVIQSFEGEKGAEGELLHPHFNVLKDDMTRLFQAGIASDLSDAYNKSLAMRPDLAVVKQPAKVAPTKTDQLAKVRKAKKAATGVKSSGAVGKKNRETMSLEQEIASHFQ